jgi:GNAT superfamily N-acetyltransferase
MSAPKLFVVRRFDGFYRCWHAVADPAPMPQASALYNQLTNGGTRCTTPEDGDYYELFSTSLPGKWTGGPQLLIRRLHPGDSAEILAHLLRLDSNDRRLRFFHQVTDAQVRSHFGDLDWRRSLIFGAISADRVAGVAEAFLDHPITPHHAEIAVSVDASYRGRGLGQCLVSHMIDWLTMLRARQAGFVFLLENRPIQRIIRELGGIVDMENLYGVIRMHDFEETILGAHERLAA